MYLRHLAVLDLWPLDVVGNLFSKSLLVVLLTSKLCHLKRDLISLFLL